MTVPVATFVLALAMSSIAAALRTAQRRGSSPDHCLMRVQLSALLLRIAILQDAGHGRRPPRGGPGGPNGPE